eukprot:7095155-Pyramimonas_sp.AAC.1
MQSRSSAPSAAGTCRSWGRSCQVTRPRRRVPRSPTLAPRHHPVNPYHPHLRHHPRSSQEKKGPFSAMSTVLQNHAPQLYHQYKATALNNSEK